MKIQDINTVKNQGSFPHFFLILSKDCSEQKYYFDEIKKHIAMTLNMPLDSFPLKRMDGESFSLDHFKQEIFTPSLFSSKSFLCVSQFEKIPNHELKELSLIIEKEVPWIFCFFLGTVLAEQTQFYKTIKQKGWIFQKPEEKNWEKEKNLIQWVIDQARDLEKIIDLKTAQFFIQYIEPERNILKTELLKVINYLGEKKTIESSDIRQVCTQHCFETLWQLGDLIFQRDKTEALKCAHHLLSQQKIFPLIAHLRSQFQNAYHIHTLFVEGGEGAVTASFPYLKGNLLEKKINLIKNFGLARLKLGICNIHCSELASRNSQIESQLLFELLIIHLIDGSHAISFSQFAGQG